MSRVIALCFLLLAAVIGLIHIDGRPVWSPFMGNSEKPMETTAPEEVQKPFATKANSRGQSVELSPKVDWLPDTGAASVHAASLIALKDGNVRAFWFAGSREGAPDVVINSAIFDTKSTSWGDAAVVIDRVAAEKGLSRYVAKLGNPVPARLPDGRLQLFFVTVSIGGWAGSSISTVISDDEGLSWSKPQRLITSPFMNISTLVKSPAVLFVDGHLGLPAYHEWIGHFGEFLRLDVAQVLDKRRMSSGRSAIQPLVFVNSAQDATAYFRQTRRADQPKQIPVSQTQDAGQTWQSGADLEIANPNSAVAGLSLGNGARILALNNIEAGRHRLVLLMRNPQSGAWQVIHVLEDDEAVPDLDRKEFSYPYLITMNGKDAHLVYTWDRKKIRHVYLSNAWLSQSLNQLLIQGSSNQTEAGSAQ